MTKFWLRVSLAILAIFATSSVLGDTQELVDFKAAIRAKYDIKEQAFASGVSAPILEQFYSEGVFSVDNEGNTHRGREELRPLYDEVTRSSNVRIESVNTSVSGDRGWDWANFFVTPKDPKEAPFSFKILFLWEKIDGQWWCAGDMYVLGKFDTND